MTTKWLSVPAVALFAAAVLVLAAPAAEAQTRQTSLQVDTGLFSDPIRPLSGEATVDVTVTWTGVKETGRLELTPIPVELKVTDKPDWVAATLSPSTVYINPGDENGMKATAKLSVSLMADAPAMKSATFFIEAKSKEAGMYDEADGSSPVTVTPEYFGLLDVYAREQIKIARPQEQVSFPFSVSNLGNGATKVFFKVISKPDGWQVAEPAPITLQERTPDTPAVQTLNLMIQMPTHTGYLNDVGVVTLEMTSEYAFDGSRPGDRSSLSVLVTAKGFDVPAPASGMLLVPLVGVALALGGRRGFA